MKGFDIVVNRLRVTYDAKLFRECLIEYYPKWQESWMKDKDRMEKQYKETLEEFDRIVPKMGLQQYLYFCCPADFIYWLDKNIVF